MKKPAKKPLKAKAKAKKSKAATARAKPRATAKTAKKKPPARRRAPAVIARGAKSGGLDRIGSEFAKYDLVEIRAALEAEMRRRDVLEFTAGSIAGYSRQKFNEHLARELQAFYAEVQAGLAPRMIVNIPPRHGKSFMVTERGPVWFIGHNPLQKVVTASFGMELAREFGERSLSLALSEYVAEIFPDLYIHRRRAANWTTRSMVDDLVFRQYGGYKAVGILTAITGSGANVLNIDDPHKDFLEAHSKPKRDRVHQWYKSTAYTRLMPGGGVMLTQTRWNEDDLTGRLIADQKEGGDIFKVICYPAIAEENDPLGRAPGEALDPIRYPIERLKKYKETIGDYHFNALYQQRPAPLEGDLIKVEQIKVVDRYDQLPSPIRQTVRYWDKAGSDKPGACNTAGVKISQMVNGQWVLEDCVADTMEEDEREKTIKAVAISDGYGVDIWHEEEPGSGGMESARHTNINLAGFNVKSERPKGDKTIRALPFAAQVKNGNVWAVRGSWLQAYKDELRYFPHGKMRDRMDATSGAFNKMLGDDFELFQTNARWV